MVRYQNDSPSLSFLKVHVTPSIVRYKETRNVSILLTFPKKDEGGSLADEAIARIVAEMSQFPR